VPLPHGRGQPAAASPPPPSAAATRARAAPPRTPLLATCATRRCTPAARLLLADRDRDRDTVGPRVRDVDGVTLAPATPGPALRLRLRLRLWEAVGVRDGVTDRLAELDRVVVGDRVADGAGPLPGG
jgi:hypothetical protein